MMQMRWEVQVQMLRNKVKSDDIEINILRHRMDTLEELLMKVQEEEESGIEYGDKKISPNYHGEVVEQTNQQIHRE